MLRLAKGSSIMSPANYPNHRPVTILALAFVLAAVPAPSAKAQAEATLGLDEVTHGTLLMQADEPARYRPAPIQETQVEIRVSGTVARARVRQRFTNPTDVWTEAIYAFPLPEDAAVDHMRMSLGERTIEAQVQERSQARSTYRQAKAQGQRASLVEQHRPNLFTTAVANIAPQAAIEVEIEYQQLVRWHGGEFSLRFPMAITPRYAPGGTGSWQESARVEDGWAILPGEIGNTARVRPPDAAPARDELNPVTLGVTLDAGLPLAQITSRYHPVDIETESPGQATIRLAEGSVPAKRDFELVWSPRTGEVPQAAFFTEATEAGSYGLLLVVPPAQAFAGQARPPRESVFIIDTSGSMGGASLRQAKAALETALMRLAPADRFNIIQFDSRTSALFPQPVRADQGNVDRGIAYTRGLHADGGTEMRPALELALAAPAPSEAVLRQIVFITDGAVGNEAELLALIHDRLGERRLFTVGIGSAPNGYFMTEAAHFGRGTFTFIGASDEVATKMADLLSKIEQPVLTDLELDLPQARDPLPFPLPDLYAGEPVMAVMKLTAVPARAAVSGNLGGLRWSNRLSLVGSDEQTGLGVLWGRRKIQQLMRAKVRGADGEQIRAQVVAIGLNHHLVSPYTSLVAVDITPVRPRTQTLGTHHLETNPPAGWVPPNPPQPAIRIQRTPTATVAMAQGATASRLLLLAGLLALATALWLRPRASRPDRP
jgi:Ca-activated chloride channel family protein